MSKRWIHVTTALHPSGTPNVPLKRSNGKYDLTVEDELLDPNEESGSYGDDQPTKFIEGVVIAKPPYDPVTEQLNQNSTITLEGSSVPGIYNSGLNLWEVIWSVIANGLDEAKSQKRTLLDSDLETATLVGYSVGNKILTLEENQVNYHSNKISRMDHLVESGKITGADNVSIQDSNGNIITVTLAIYGDQMANYFDLVRKINDEYLIASDAIIDAVDLAEVDAITWDFDIIITTFG